MSTPRIPTARAKLPTILRSLHNAQWGVLGGPAARGQRAVLQTLSQAFLADGSGEGRATLWQIHRASGYSIRWVRTCLNRLEDLGILTWVRGTIIDGRKEPSWFRVRKARLVELIRQARGLKVKAERAHQAAEDKRLQAAGVHEKTHWPAHKPREHAANPSHHGEVAAGLLTSTEGGNKNLPPAGVKLHPADKRRADEAAIAARERVEKPWLWGERDDSAFQATASGGRDGRAPSRDALAQTYPKLAELLKRRPGQRSGRGRWQVV